MKLLSVPQRSELDKAFGGNTFLSNVFIKLVERFNTYSSLGDSDSEILEGLVARLSTDTKTDVFTGDGFVSGTGSGSVVRLQGDSPLAYQHREYSYSGSISISSWSGTVKGIPSGSFNVLLLNEGISEKQVVVLSTASEVDNVSYGVVSGSIRVKGSTSNGYFNFFILGG